MQNETFKRFCRKALCFKHGYCWSLVNSFNNLPVYKAMKFKYDHLQDEISIISPHLRAMLFEADYFSKKQFDKEIIITELLRTQAMQNAYYTSKINEGFYVIINNMKYYSLDKKSPTLSVHQVGRGADLRSTIYTEDEIELLCSHIRTYFPYNAKHKSCLYHNVGKGFHFHLQTTIQNKYDYRRYL